MYPDSGPTKPGSPCRICGNETECVPLSSVPERLKKHLNFDEYLWCPKCGELRAVTDTPCIGKVNLSIGEGSSWGSYECLPCSVVFEVRFNKEDADDIVKCPICGKLCKLDGQWEATKGGYGSTAEKDALIEELRRIRKHSSPGEI